MRSATRLKGLLWRAGCCRKAASWAPCLDSEVADGIVGAAGTLGCAAGGMSVASLLGVVGTAKLETGNHK